jgi:flagella basal body P-ring formation protein FlgA
MNHLRILLTVFSLLAIRVLSGSEDLIENFLNPVNPAELERASEDPSVKPDEPSLVERVAVVGNLPDIDLVTSLESALVVKLGLPGRVELASIGRLPKIPMDDRPVDVVLLENPQRLTGSGVVLRYEVRRSGERVGEWRTVFRCRHLAEVLVPTRRVDAGEVLMSVEFESLEVDLTRNAKAVVADPELFGRYELARAVYPGRPIAWGDLAPRAMVRKGELVDVIVREGALSISMKAMATRAGALGDIVAVRNLESKREFPAEVIDEKTVQVFF